MERLVGAVDCNLQWQSPRQKQSTWPQLREALWLKKLQIDFSITVGAMPSSRDSQGALKLLKHPIATIRSKHIDVSHQFARERVSRKEVCFASCSTDEMVADCFTKPLPVSKFRLCCSGLGAAQAPLFCYAKCFGIYFVVNSQYL